MAEIKITADASQAQREISKLDKTLNSLGVSSAGVKTAFATLTAAAAGVGYAMSRVMVSAGQLNDTAQQLNISATGLQNLQRAAEQAGVGADQLTTSMFKLRQNIGDALVKGTGPASDALKRLGLDAQKLSTQSLDKTFKDVTRALSAIPNEAERSSVAMDLFGKTGARISEITESAEAFRKKMEEIGVAVSDADFAAIDRAGDKFDELKAVIENGLQKALSNLAPYIEQMVNWFEDAIKNIVTHWDDIVKVLKVVGIALAGLALYFAPIPAAIAVVTAAILRWPGVFGKVADVIMVFLAPIVGMLRLLGGLVIGVLDGIEAKMNGKNFGEAFTKSFNAIAYDANNAKNNIGGAAQATERFGAVYGEQVVPALLTGKKAIEDTGRALDDNTKKLLKEAETSVAKLEAETKLQRDKISLGDAEANTQKSINDINAKLLDIHQKLTSKQEERIRNTYLEQDALKLQVSIAKELESLATEAISLSIQDSTERQVALTIRKLELDTKQKLNEADREGIKTAIEQNQALKDQEKLRQAVLKSQGVDTAPAVDIAIKGMDVAKELDPVAKITEEYKLKQQALDYAQAQELLSKDEFLKASRALEDKYYADKSAAEEKSKQDSINRVTDEFRIKLEKAGMTNQAMIDQVVATRKIMAQIENGQISAAQGSLQIAANIFTQLGAHNKKAFETAKKLNIALALINTWTGVTKAIAEYGFPMGLILGGVILAAGMAQIAQIRSQQYSGRALGGPVMGNKPYLVGENGPELFTPNTTGSITRNSDLQSGGPVNINFTIVANDTKGFDQLLSSRKGVIQQIISDAMLERGQRSMI